MWSKITVGKFQELYDILHIQQFDSDIERRISLLSCVDGKPIEHYENLSFDQLREELKKIDFLSTGEMPQVKPARYFKVGGKRFKVIYEFKHLKAGQFIDVLNAAKGVDEQVPNLHLTLAAICLEVKRNMFFKENILKYGSTEFDQVAELMKRLPFVLAQATALFFYQVWERFLSSMPAYSKEMKARKKIPTGLEAVLTGWDSSNVGAGS
ncbi:hypothetical protein [Chitinophaga sp.]|uniref:hypothetical protein n=1 Tax=Chitinophaga sp. TaxID=1869181 RepID=UPI002C39D268|nr:hypothetical protein [Chitinophaga sp.]HWV64358.1 hypothetical protein [Chitinophaga sp.]